MYRSIRATPIVMCALVLAPMAHAQLIRPQMAVTDGVVLSSVISGNTLYIGGVFQFVGPPTGGGVPTDATTGSPLAKFPKVAGSVDVVVPDGNGGWYIGGEFTGVGREVRRNLARIRSDYTVSSWDPDMNSGVSALVLDGSTLYVGGSFTNVGGQPIHYLAAISTITGQPLSWAPNPDNGVITLALSGSTLYVGGAFTSIGGQPRSHIAAVSTLSGLATSWNPGASDLVRTLALGAGVVYVGGDFAATGGASRARLAAISLTTGLATSWNPNPTNGAAVPLILDVAVNGSTVYVGGSFQTIGGQSRTRLAAVDATTGLATGWNPTLDNQVQALAVVGTTVYIAGNFTMVSGVNRQFLAAVDAGSGSATSWNPQAGKYATSVAVSGSTVYVGGAFASIDAQPRSCIAAIDITTGAVTSWNPSASPSNGQVLSLAKRAGTIYAAGSFNSIGGQTRNGLAALDSTTGLATSWNPAVGGLSCVAVGGNTVYVGGGFNTAGGQARRRFAAFDATTAALLPWNPNGNQTPLVMLVDGSIVYAGGSFGTVGNLPRNGLVALDAVTGVPTTWTGNMPNGSDVYALARWGSNLYIGGRFAAAGGQPRSNLASLDIGTGLATPWNPDPDQDVLSLAVADSIVFVGGRFNTIAGRYRNRVAGIGATSTTLTQWYPYTDGDAHTMVAQGNDLFVGGDFTRTYFPERAAFPQSYLAAFVIHPPKCGKVGAHGANLYAVVPDSDPCGDDIFGDPDPAPPVVPAVLKTPAPAVLSIAPSARSLGGGGQIVRIQMGDRAAGVRLRVYDVTGRARRDLLNETLPAHADRNVVWDETSDDGAKVMPGVYFYRLQVGSWSQGMHAVVMGR